MSHLLLTHIACMALGFALLIVHGLASHNAARSAQRERIITILQRRAWMGHAGRAGVLLGLALGLVLARPYGYLAPWLLAAYAATLASIAIGAAGLEPFQKRLLAAARRGDDLRPFQHSRVPLYACLGNSVLWTAIVWLMLAKPV